MFSHAWTNFHKTWSQNFICNQFYIFNFPAIDICISFYKFYIIWLVLFFKFYFYTCFYISIDLYSFLWFRSLNYIVLDILLLPFNLFPYLLEFISPFHSFTFLLPPSLWRKYTLTSFRPFACLVRRQPIRIIIAIIMITPTVPITIKMMGFPAIFKRKNNCVNDLYISLKSKAYLHETISS